MEVAIPNSRLASWSARRLGLAMLGAFGLGVIFLVIGIMFELAPTISVAGLLGSLVFVVIFGVRFLDAIERRRREPRDPGQ